MFWPNLAKLINQEGCCCSFLIETSQNFKNEKNFLCLKIAEIDMGGQFWVEKNNSGHKTNFFKVKPIFQGYISKFNDLFPSLEGNFMALVALMTHTKFHFNRLR